MLRIIKPAAVVAGVVVSLFLMVCGCQKGRTAVPARNVESSVDDATPVQPRASVPVESPSQPAPAEAPKAEATPAEPNQAGLPVSLVLGFSSGQVATYRATTEAEKSVEWMGPESDKPATYSDGRSGNYVEMTFEQRVRQVRDRGDAILDITIRGLKYRGQIQNRTVFDFDSTRPADQENPLAALTGKSYRLEMSAMGQVLALIDMDSVRQAVGAGSPAYGVAAKLFSEELVRDRHEVPPVSALKGDPVRPGRQWSDLPKPFSFGDMGLKGYERVYTLKQVLQGDGRFALVEMKAIPSSAMAEEMHKRQTGGAMAGLFDNTDKYEGRLDFDLDNGRVREYVETLQIQWVILDPAAMQDTTAQPRALKMSARRLHRLELVRQP